MDPQRRLGAGNARGSRLPEPGLEISGLYPPAGFWGTGSRPPAKPLAEPALGLRSADQHQLAPRLKRPDGVGIEVEVVVEADRDHAVNGGRIGRPTVLPHAFDG